ncbi:5'/3'-nucleotidase SurE [Psychrobacter ciconiae]|uniref:5'/3'-nucleotidase SurE n=1 Tax=Psychrobacter ciconiae TaxID=1553449 RepID=UPI00191ACC4D|nr:5'/3'-nucleotidase SurE [Psychrobacter ciconiae]
MKILISNDDGVFAPGLIALYNKLSTIAEVKVVAPSSEQSGSASALTVVRPLHQQKLPSGFIAIDGTPADCVYLALNELFAHTTFDWVISGINSGANVGQDVLFSGTFGAAATAQLFGVPAMAISLAMTAKVGLGQEEAEYYDQAAHHVANLLQQDKLTTALKELPYHVLNVNIPDSQQHSSIQGQKITTLSHQALINPVQQWTDPRGRRAYWLSLKKDNQRADARWVAKLSNSNAAQVMTDSAAIQAGFISLTPVSLPDSPSQSIAKLARLINNG